MRHTYKVRSRAVIVNEEKLLVVKHRPESDYYALPGGHLDPGEDPKECVEREIFEELGIQPVIGRLLYVYTFTDKDGVQSIEFFFEVLNGAEYQSVAGGSGTHAHEIAEVRWVGKDEEITLLPPEFLREFREGKVFSDTVRFMKG